MQAIVFQRIGAGDVIIVCIAQAHGDAGGLVDPAGNGAKLHPHIDVHCRHGIVERKWKPVIGVRSVETCSIVRCDGAVASSVTLHCAGLPCPVRAKVNPAGGIPGII
jgi:hypothetical protein